MDTKKIQAAAAQGMSMFMAGVRVGLVMAPVVFVSALVVNATVKK